jgi:hypothetical protein
LALSSPAHADPIRFPWTVAKATSLPETVQLTKASPLYLGSIATEHMAATAVERKDTEPFPDVGSPY